MKASHFRHALEAKISEAILHRRVAEYLDAVLAPPWFWSTIPAGGGGRVRGAQLKARGYKPGFPDLLIFGPGKVLGIELKRSSGGALSDEQKAMAQRFHDCGWDCELARSVEAVNHILFTVGALSNGIYTDPHWNAELASGKGRA